MRWQRIGLFIATLVTGLYSGHSNAARLTGIEYQPIVIASEPGSSASTQSSGANISLNFSTGNPYTEFSIPINRYTASLLDCCDAKVLDIELQHVYFTNKQRTGFYAGGFLRAQTLNFQANSNNTQSVDNFRWGFGLNVGVRYSCEQWFDSILAGVLFPILYCSSGVRAAYMHGNVYENETGGYPDQVDIKLDLIRFGIRFD